MIKQGDQDRYEFSKIETRSALQLFTLQTKFLDNFPGTWSSITEKIQIQNNGIPVQDKAGFNLRVQSDRNELKSISGV